MGPILSPLATHRAAAKVSSQTPRCALVSAIHSFPVAAQQQANCVPRRQYAISTAADKARKVAIVGSGTIGLSFAALHLTRNPLCIVKIYDPRPDLSDYVSARLTHYLPPGQDAKSYTDRLEISRTLADATKDANIVQEQGPEKRSFKASLWQEVEQHARPDALLWSSTSGITATAQSEAMQDKGRVLVVHPFNPPHILPLLEVVPSPETKSDVVERTLAYWRALGRTPVVVNSECTGFVANRLAFALFREACSLVQKGVISVVDLDSVVTASLGPRFAVSGPFKAYHAGGGEGGMSAFFDKIGGTIQETWDASDLDMKQGDIRIGAPWQGELAKQCEDAFGEVDTTERDSMIRKVLEAVKKD